MYKKFFMGIAAMAALTLVSCSSDDLNSVSDNSSKNEAISFDGYLGRSAVAVNGSRGSVLDNTTLPSKGFGVFGNYSSATDQTFGSNLFNNVKVTGTTSTGSTGGTTWTYDHKKYWPTEGHIDFLAYAPYAKNTALTESKINFTVAGEVAKQKDLLWANATNQTKDNISSTNKFYVIVEYTIKDYNGVTTPMKNTVYQKLEKNFEQGKAYTINLTLGLTPIEFDVTTVEGLTDTNQGEINSWN